MNKIISLVCMAVVALTTVTCITSCGGGDDGGDTPTDIKVTKITLTDASVAVGSTTTITKVVEPSNATNQSLSWSSSDKSIATVKDGTVTGVKAGIAIITAKATDGSGVSGTCTVTVTGGGGGKIEGIVAGPNGKSTNTGTEASPYDIRTAISMLSSTNNVLSLLDGTYDIGTSCLRLKTSNVTIKAVNARKAILDGRNEPYNKSGYNQVGLYIDANNVTVQGIVVQYAGKNGIFCSGSNNTFENVEARYNCNSGFQMKGTGGNNKLINCDSHHNFDYENGGTSSPDYGGDADGFADKQYTGPGNSYTGCRSWMNSDDGWDSYERVTSSGGEPTRYVNCICYANGPKTFDLSSNPRITGVDKDWFTGCGQTITSYTNYGNGNGFKVGGNATVHNVYLDHCLSVGHNLKDGVKGFDQNNNNGEMTIINCTSFDNTRNYGFGSSKTSADKLTITNCISYKGSKNDSWISGRTTATTNSWNIGITVANSDFQSVVYDAAALKTLMGDRDSSGNIVESTFMHLSSGSQLKGRGTPSETDLGCYPYSN